MYTIGEFARMAQVSRRQLRHWDDIGLLRPAKVDPETGYRYYSANQLPALNRIVALRELDLSLEQIRRFIEEDVSLEEMQGMLMLRKAELERQIEAEMRRVRNIESRLKQIREQGRNIQDVVVKQVEPAMFISVRSIVADWESVVQVWDMAEPLMNPAKPNLYGDPIGILHAGGITTDYFDMEVGRVLNAKSHPPMETRDGQPFTVQELPASLMASFVHRGLAYEAHISFSAVGEWAEINHYAFAGPMRAIVLPPYQFDDADNLMAEVQFPIEKRPAMSSLIDSEMD